MKIKSKSSGNRKAIIALILLIVTLIGSTYTRIEYDNSGTLETNFGAKSADHSNTTPSNTLNSNIFNTAKSLYNSDYMNDCSGYVNYVLNTVTGSSFSYASGTWYSTLSSWGLGGTGFSATVGGTKYNATVVATGSTSSSTSWVDNITWASGVDQKLYPGDIISANGHMFIYVGYYDKDNDDEVRKLRETIGSYGKGQESTDGLYTTRFWNYNTGTNYWFLQGNTTSTQKHWYIKLSNWSWKSSGTGKSNTVKDFVILRYISNAPTTTTIKFDIVKTSSDDSSQKVNARFSYQLYDANPGTSDNANSGATLLKSGTVTANSSVVSFSGLEVNKTYYLRLKESYTPSGWSNDYDTWSVSTIKINSSGNVSEWSFSGWQSGSVTKKSTNYYRYNLINTPDDSLAIYVKKQFYNGSEYIDSENSYITFTLQYALEDNDSSYINGGMEFEVNADNKEHLILSMDKVDTLYIKLKETEVDIAGSDYHMNTSLGTIKIKITNGTATIMSESGSLGNGKSNVSVTVSGSTTKLSITLVNTVEEYTPTYLKMYKTDSYGNNLSGVSWEACRLVCYDAAEEAGSTTQTAFLSECIDKDGNIIGQGNSGVWIVKTGTETTSFYVYDAIEGGTTRR